MTTHEKLDAVLEVLNEGHKEKYNIIKTTTEIDGKTIPTYVVAEGDPHMMQHFIIHKKIMRDEINIGEVEIILQYLIRKSLCQFHDDGNRYSITFEGKVLIEDGGFGAQHEQDVRERQEAADHKTRVEGLQSDVRDWTRKAVTAAWFAASGAFAIVIWEILKFFWLEPMRQTLYHAFPFLTSLLKLI